MKKLKTVLTAATLALFLVVAGDYLAYAATGDSLILGRGNNANKITSLTRTTNGPVLNLDVKNRAAAPLKVDGAGRVANLNADRVDGKHANQLGVRTSVFTHPLNATSISSLNLTLPGVAPGTYLVTVNGWIYGPSTATMECRVFVTDTSASAAHTWNRSDINGYYPVTGAGLIEVPSGSVSFRCNMATGNYSTFSGSPIQVSLTAVDQVTSQTPGRAGARRSSGAAG
jgi:hypothetical protein